MKFKILFLLLLGSVVVQAQEIQWMTLAEALEAQKTAPKKIFMDVYTKWCGPCKLLDKKTFANRDVARYISEHYYAVKFNAEGNEEFEGNLEGFQGIEAQNLQHLQFGTASAESITLSFWVKTNKTGTYSLAYINSDASRSYVTTYTISSANTWEKKTITIAGDTTGSINNDNGVGLWIYWNFGAGSDWGGGTVNNAWETTDIANLGAGTTVNLADSTSNYINITGVQLEVGTEATPFENRMYSTELAMCQRYYQTAVMTFTVGVEGTRNTEIPFPLKVSMRTAPTCTFSGGTASNGAVLGTPVTNITTEMVCPHVFLGASGSLQNAEFSGYTFTASSEL